MCNLIYNIFYVLATQESQRNKKKTNNNTYNDNNKNGKMKQRWWWEIKKNLLENFADKANRIAKNKERLVFILGGNTKGKSFEELSTITKDSMVSV